MSEWCSNDTWLVIDSWSLTAQIRNSVCGQREFCKITMTSSRHNFHFSNSTPLLIFDWQPPPWYKFLSLLSLLLPLKSKMVAIIFVTKILSSCLPKLNLLCRLVNHTTCLQNSQVSHIECKTLPKIQSNDLRLNLLCLMHVKYLNCWFWDSKLLIYLSKYNLLLIPIQLAVSTFLQLEILIQTHHGFNG